MSDYTAQDIMDYCMSKPCVYESRPFGEYPICYRVSGKIYAQLSPKPDWYKITLKTNPQAAEFYRTAFPGVVVRGYHCPPVQQPYWNTISLEEFPKDTLFQMIDEAYQVVMDKFSKKLQNRLSFVAGKQFKKTDGTDTDFIALCEKLDQNLDEIVGTHTQRSKYDAYNKRDNIHDVILIYDGSKPVGCGSYKLYDEDTVELKRIYVDPEYRSEGLGRDLLYRLEADAKIAGYSYAVLETGDPLIEAMHLYKKAGYKTIDNYGPYVNMPASICMKKKL